MDLILSHPVYFINTSLFHLLFVSPTNVSSCAQTSAESLGRNKVSRGHSFRCPIFRSLRKVALGTLAGPRRHLLAEMGKCDARTGKKGLNTDGEGPLANSFHAGLPTPVALKGFLPCELVFKY